MRRVRVGGARSVELRVEVFNLLNTANFGAPAATAGRVELRDDHLGAGSPDRAARGEVLVLRIIG